MLTQAISLMYYKETQPTQTLAQEENDLNTNYPLSGLEPEFTLPGWSPKTPMP